MTPLKKNKSICLKAQNKQKRTKLKSINEKCVELSCSLTNNVSKYKIFTEI